MKLIILIVLSAIIFLTSCGANKHDFKNFDFGETREAIIESEGNPSINDFDAGLVRYSNQSILGLSNAEITYFFKDDLLFSVKVSCLNFTQADFETAKKEMIKKYGEPLPKLSDETMLCWDNGFLSYDNQRIFLLWYQTNDSNE